MAAAAAGESTRDSKQPLVVPPPAADYKARMSACLDGPLRSVAGLSSQHVFSQCNKDDPLVQAETQRIFGCCVDTLLSGGDAPPIDADTLQWFINYLIDHRGLSTPVCIVSWYTASDTAINVLIRMAQLDPGRVSLSQRDGFGRPLLDTVDLGRKQLSAEQVAAIVAAADDAAFQPRHTVSRELRELPVLARAIRRAASDGPSGMAQFRLLMTRAEADGSGLRVDAQKWLDEREHAPHRSFVECTVWSHIDELRHHNMRCGAAYAEMIADLDEITRVLDEAQRKQAEYRTSLAGVVDAAMEPGALRSSQHGHTTNIAVIVADYLLFY